MNTIKKDHACLPLLKALQRQGFTDKQLHNYMMREGMSYDQSMEIIRQLNK
jgi:hypothetical protein